MKKLSIYIHIPFCVRKCLYCDFLSFSVGETDYAEVDIINNYVDLLTREVETEAAKYENFQVVSIFFGGGTPSLLSGELVSKIVSHLKNRFHLAQDVEITIEMNPGTVNFEKLCSYRETGINRISIGLQSTEDTLLKKIGRIHDYNQFLVTYEEARSTGFDNINVDLMAALPGQTMEMYEKSLQQIVQLAPEHISAYGLILEEGTPLYEQREKYSFPCEEEEREMYDRTGVYLAQNGYRRYEISNYAKPGRECRHNVVYWERGNYVGFGLGAASMVENVRWSNTTQMSEYKLLLESGIKQRAGICAKQETIQTLTVKEQMEEYMFLGLRLMRGVHVGQFERLFGQTMDGVYGKVIERFLTDKLLEYNGKYLKLTKKGIDISNYVMSDFIFD